MYSKSAGNGRPSHLRRWPKSSGAAWLLISFLMTAIMAAFIGNVAQAQTTSAVPLAGTKIGNQAAATYTDATGQQREVVSNTVQTEVQHVPSHTLEADRSVISAPNQTVYFAHTVTNTGNGPDTYDLAAIAGGTGFTPDNIKVFADANGDGEPDDATVITNTGVLAPGESFSFVVEAHVPSGASAGAEGTVDVTATGRFTSTAHPTPAVEANTDTITVSNNGVITVSKAISQDTIAPAAFGDSVTYTLTIKNKGQKAAENVTITDVLDSRLAYVPGSARWNGLATVLTDANDGTQNLMGDVIDYQYDGTNTITAVIDEIDVNAEKKLTFQVTVVNNTGPGTIPNAATFSYNDGTPSPGGDIPAQSTNEVLLNVTAAAGVVEEPSDGRNNRVVEEAPQNSTVVFTNVFQNTGTGPDTFDITINAGNTFPAGTTFGLFKEDGGTPLVDTNGNGTVDTGVVAAGANFVVVVKAYLPAGANSANTPPTGTPPGYRVTKTATSTVDPTESAEIEDRLESIVPSTVVLDNGTTGSTWNGTSGPVTTLPANPGQTVRFTLRVTNNGAGSENYDLSAYSDAAFTQPLNDPAHFTVVFRNTSETVITNSGNVPAGATVTFYADVTVAPDRAPILSDTDPDSHIYFRVVSRSTGATASKLDAVTVNTVRDLEIAPDNTGQTTANNSITYLHRITNNGNVAEEFKISDLHSDGSFYANFYEDINGDGILPAGQAPLDKNATITLQPGESFDLFVRVFAPADAVPGMVDVATITVTPDNATINGVTLAPVSATDTTTIVSGQLVIQKEQVLDPLANGVISGAYTKANIDAEPGQGIRYRITVTNNGTAPVHDVVVSDSTPLYTSANNGNGSVSSAGSATYQVFTNGIAGGYLSTGDTVTIGGTSVPAVIEPGAGNTGSYKFNIGTLAPSQTAIVYFGVTING